MWPLIFYNIMDRDFGDIRLYRHQAFDATLEHFANHLCLGGELDLVGDKTAHTFFLKYLLRRFADKSHGFPTREEMEKALAGAGLRYAKIEYGGHPHREVFYHIAFGDICFNVCFKSNKCELLIHGGWYWLSALDLRLDAEDIVQCIIMTARNNRVLNRANRAAKRKAPGEVMIRKIRQVAEEMSGSGV